MFLALSWKSRTFAHSMKHTIYIMSGLLALASCSSNLKKENEALHDEIDERREQLDNSLKEKLEAAQKELEATNSLLEKARREHDEQHEWVMSHATLLRLNSLRAQRDSLQVEFEKQAQKVKFFMKKVEGKDEE